MPRLAPVTRATAVVDLHAIFLWVDPNMTAVILLGEEEPCGDHGQCVVLQDQRFARRRQRGTAVVVVAQRARELQRADQRAGHHGGSRPGGARQCCANVSISRATRAPKRLAPQPTGAACRCRARRPGNRSRETRGALGEIRLDERTECARALAAARLSGASHRFGAIAAGASKSFHEQRVSRIEVGVEAAMRQPGLFHDVSDADSRITVAAKRTRGDVHDALVGLFPAAVGCARHDRSP